MTYATLKEWLDEIEGFTIRRERMHLDAFEWIETAWKLGAKAEREACAQLADEGFAYATDDHAEDMARTLAKLIRARTD